MSIQSAKAYVEKLKADEDFAKHIISAADAKTRQEIILTEGFNFTKTDINFVVSELSDEETSELYRGAWTGAVCECSREGELGCRAP